LSPISLERTLQVLFGEDRKNMLDDCFFVFAILILHKFDLTLHASLMIIFFNKKKFGGENAGNFFFFLFLACQILHVFLPDILVHCALIDYALI
jgi:hypothetical protein